MEHWMGVGSFWYGSAPQWRYRGAWTKNLSRYYESLEDLDTKMQMSVERWPSLEIDWGANRVLTEEDLGRVAMCLAALPTQGEREKSHGR
jgi:hypothetical protein